MNSLPMPLANLHLRLRRSSLPMWIKLAIVVGVVGTAVYVLIRYWWVFTAVAVGYVIGRNRP